MTLAARKVLDDCHIALGLLEEEVDLRKWQIHWVAALALVRAVGHILHKIDGKNPLLKNHINEQFRKWKDNDKKHIIFREFIEAERNNILKQYEFNYDNSEDVFVTIDLGSSKEEHVSSIGDNLYRPIAYGYWAGDDARDVYKEALQWWDRELELIAENNKIT